MAIILGLVSGGGLTLAILLRPWFSQCTDVFEGCDLHKIGYILKDDLAAIFRVRVRGESGADRHTQHSTASDVDRRTLW